MSENREKLLKDIQEQGDLVRKLKVAKESAEKVSDSEKYFVNVKSVNWFMVKKTMKEFRRENKLRLEKDTLQTKLPHVN